METISFSIANAGDSFTFELCCKRQVQFGSLQADQFWMRVPSLYGQRRRSESLDPNFEQILRVYWHAVQAQCATACRDAQERYLLATLVPYVRAEGSRRIFGDAFLRRTSQDTRTRDLQTLDEDILQPSRTTRLSRTDFSRQTWQLLGANNLTSEIQRQYRAQLSPTLDRPCELLERGNCDEAVRVAHREWQRFMQSIGRRRGNAAKKTALDVISYEARAAFHHCYSVTWIALTYALFHSGQIDATSQRLHRFWHTVDEEQDGITLFHGHVFVLHPAMGQFLLSLNGRKLLGDWATNHESTEAYESLLCGIFLALTWYDSRRDMAREQRPNAAEISAAMRAWEDESPEEVSDDD